MNRSRILRAAVNYVGSASIATARPLPARPASRAEKSQGHAKHYEPVRRAVAAPQSAEELAKALQRINAAYTSPTAAANAQRQLEPLLRSVLALPVNLHLAGLALAALSRILLDTVTSIPETCTAIIDRLPKRWEDYPDTPARDEIFYSLAAINECLVQGIRLQAWEARRRLRKHQRLAEVPTMSPTRVREMKEIIRADEAEVEMWTAKGDKVAQTVLDQFRKVVEVDSRLLVKRRLTVRLLNRAAEENNGELVLACRTLMAQRGLEGQLAYNNALARYAVIAKKPQLAMQIIDHLLQWPAVQDADRVVQGYTVGTPSRTQRFAAGYAGVARTGYDVRQREQVAMGDFVRGKIGVACSTAISALTKEAMPQWEEYYERAELTLAPDIFTAVVRTSLCQLIVLPDFQRFNIRERIKRHAHRSPTPAVLEVYLLISQYCIGVTESLPARLEYARLIDGDALDIARRHKLQYAAGSMVTSIGKALGLTTPQDISIDEGQRWNRFALSQQLLIAEANKEGLLQLKGDTPYQHGATARLIHSLVVWGYPAAAMSLALQFSHKTMQTRDIEPFKIQMWVLEALHLALGGRLEGISHRQFDDDVHAKRLAVAISFCFHYGIQIHLFWRRWAETVRRGGPEVQRVLKDVEGIKRAGHAGMDDSLRFPRRAPEVVEEGYKLELLSYTEASRKDSLTKVPKGSDAERKLLARAERSPNAGHVALRGMADEIR